mmetsp:Transcript_53536/g.124713  ORF Transcript_53536/g.124713 Transcript_53536/m.124713 type:complete len:99 (-) Transcript_53536:82-378(-)
MLPNGDLRRACPAGLRCAVTIDLHEPPLKRVRRAEPNRNLADCWQRSPVLEGFDVVRDKVLGELAAGGPLALEFLPNGARSAVAEELQAYAMELEPWC